MAGPRPGRERPRNHRYQRELSSNVLAGHSAKMTCSAERQLRVANVNVGKKIAVATQATSTVTVTTGSDPNFGPQSVLNRSSAGRETTGNDGSRRERSIRETADQSPLPPRRGSSTLGPGAAVEVAAALTPMVSIESPRPAAVHCPSPAASSSVPTSEARAKRVIDQIACGGHCHKQHEIIRGAPGAALMGASRRYRRRIDRARRHWPVPELDVRGRIITPRGRDALGRLIEG